MDPGSFSVVVPISFFQYEGYRVTQRPDDLGLRVFGGAESESGLRLWPFQGLHKTGPYLEMVWAKFDESVGFEQLSMRRVLLNR